MTHALGPIAAMVRFPIETYPKSEFDPSEPHDEVKYPANGLIGRSQSHLE